MDMPTPPDAEMAPPLQLGIRQRIAALSIRRKRVIVGGIAGLLLLAGVTSLLLLKGGRTLPSWNIGASQGIADLSPSDVRNLEARLAALKPGTPGFGDRADDHLKLLSTLKIIDGRGGLTLDRHLLQFIAAVRKQVRTADAANGYDLAEQAFGLIDDRGMRQVAAERLGLLTMSGQISAPDRVERLFRIWSSVDRECLQAGHSCDQVTHDFALYFAAHAQVNADAQQAAFLLARRLGNVGQRTTAYRQIGALLMRPVMRDQNDTALTVAVSVALKTKQAKTALAAASAMSTNPKGSRDTMLRLVEDNLLGSQNVVDALDAALAISGPANRDAALLHFVNDGLSKGYMHEAQVAQAAIGNADSKTLAAMQIGLSFADGGYNGQAQPYLGNAVAQVSAMTPGAPRELAAAYAARGFAEAGNIETAKTLIAMAGDSGTLREEAVKSIAEVYIGTKDVDGLVALADDARGATAGDMFGKAAALAARNGDLDRAADIVAKQRDTVSWLQAAGRLALGGLMSKEWASDAKAKLKTIAANDPAYWDSFAFADAAFSRASGDLSGAVRKMPLITDPGVRADVAKSVGVALLNRGNFDGAMGLLGQFTSGDTRSRDSLKAALALELGKSGAIRAASYAVKSMSDINSRVRTFHLLARIQAGRLDRFKALKGGAQPVIPDADRALVPGAQMERSIYAAFDVKQQSLGDYIPRLPDSDAIDVGAVKRDFAPADDSSALDIVPLVNNDYNKKFLTARSVQDDWTLVGATIVMAAQGTRHPVYLHLSRGRVTIPQLWEQLVLRGQGDFLGRKGRTYTLRAPLFVGSGAMLTLSGSDVSALRMSTERAAFIVNAGNFRMSDTILSGWSEKTSAPMEMTYDSKHEFRPFYIAWSNSNTRVAGSQFLNLGYSAGKAYGMTLTYGPVTLLQRNVEQVRPPTGTFVENSFQHMLYGFYSYEANDVQVVGNEYRDNIVYGIDPHDRSHKLLFSYNTVYGSGKKHGIIGSRNVEDSWFVGNLTFENKGSGMMMDRYAGRNILYANTAFDNHANGISIYESPCNLISSNTVFKNGRSGITVRNSWDVGIFHNQVQDNHNLGIEGYAVEFITKPGAPARNLLLDPYEQFLSTAAVSNKLKNNHQGGMGMLGMGAMLVQGNTMVGPAKRLFLNDLKLAERDLGARQAAGVMIASGCPRPKRPYSCPFVPQNYLSRELSAAPAFGKPFASCPGNTIVNAATQKGAQSLPLDKARDEEADDEDLPRPLGATL
ncbi:hypothetical protein C1T17_05535 [Sphingobium sp. SCG-1]|uniref:right-handed parallel beta-helix repeat-containing protein n=1 Tax=Sphingobium sp. SCG-1 TaxID=2072936 RepID=UPI000CD69C95|nr:right-handed parallel beta-helix repeat-containing protein [Sphingobium sp. SCG-1]AUW57644.1 hypothetical protein C1T17_05535 [Sphingobium sp. SCG-1]